MTALLLALGAPTRSRADDASDRAAAEALFAEGRRLMASGDYAHACPKLAASQKLDRAVGTSLNLAECYEKSGRTASAWIEFREAASAARAVGSREREQLARDRARALEPRLSYLTITTAPGQRDVVRVTRDGGGIDPAALGVAVPTDPGAHVVEATAPGKRSWSRRVEVGPVGARVAVEIPALSGAGATAGEPRAVSGAAASSTEMTATSSSGNGQRVLGASLAGLAVVATGAGVVLGLKAHSNWSTATGDCASPPYRCSPDAISLGQDAKSAANTATVAFAIGAAALAGGAILYFTAPNVERTRGLSLRISPAGAGISGTFQ